MTDQKTMTESMTRDDTLQLDLVCKNLRELLEVKSMAEKAV